MNLLKNYIGGKKVVQSIGSTPLLACTAFSIRHERCRYCCFICEHLSHCFREWERREYDHQGFNCSGHCPDTQDYVKKYGLPPRVIET